MTLCVGRRQRQTCWGVSALLFALLPAQVSEAATFSATPEPAQVQQFLEADALATPEPAQIEQALEQQLSLEDYAFCNDPEYVLLKVERRLCRYAQEASARCPAFASACARPASMDRDSAWWGQGWAGRSQGFAWPEDDESPAWKVELPEGLVALFRVLFFLLVAVAALALALYVARHLGRSRRRKSSESPARDARDSALPPPPLQPPAESDAQKLLARARRWAAQGDYAAAISDLHAALLHHLSQRRLLTLQASKTNGDYTRELKPHPQCCSVLRESANSVEKLQFGQAPADEASFFRLLSSVEPLLTRQLLAFLWLLSAAVASAPLVGCDDSGREKRVAHPGALGDPSAQGFSALRTLLEQRGLEVEAHTGSISSMAPDVQALFIYDQTALTAADWATLERWVEEGHQLVVAGDPNGIRHFGAELTTQACQDSVELTTAYTGIRRKDAAPYADPPTVNVLAKTNTLHLTEDTPLAPLIRCDSGVLAAFRTLGLGTVTLLADADLVANALLAAADNAIVFVSLLPAPPATIQFAGGLVGSGAESPVQSLTSARLNLLLIQLGLFLAVLYWARGAAFGKLRDPAIASKREFMDHVQALGQVFARAKAGGYALATYTTWALERLHLRIRPGTRMSVIELSVAISERTGLSRKEVLQVLAEAASARDRGENAGDEQEDLKTLRELERLVLETGGKH